MFNVFDAFKRNHLTLQLTVDRPDKLYYPGDTVRAEVLIEGKRDLKIQRGRVALFYVEEYQYRYDDSDNDEQTSWETNEQCIDQQVIIQEGVIPGDARQTYKFITTLPDDTYPTCEGGKLAKAKWLVKVTLGRKLALNYNVEQEINVAVSPSAQVNNAGVFGASNKPDDVELAFELPGKEWVAGETIEGQLRVSPKKAFKAKGVRVELVRREYVAHKKGNEYVTTTAQVKVAKNIEFQPDQNLTYPFDLTIPASSPPTKGTRHSSMTWKLKGIVGRGLLRSDAQVEEGVFVYTGRGS